MKFFVDTADIKQIEDLIPTGFVDGVTTNPSLLSKQNTDMKETIKNINGNRFIGRGGTMQSEDLFFWKQHN